MQPVPIRTLDSGHASEHDGQAMVQPRTKKQDATPALTTSAASSASSSCPSPPSDASIALQTLPLVVSAAAKTGAFLREATALDSNTKEYVDNVTIALRVLAADAVENAKSGHPGMPLGMAPTAATLWDLHLKFNPGNPTWINRDRFVLSAGHGSILLYSLLHLYGFQSIGIDELKSFRQRGSKAAGHPENILTQGVEVTTGALGQGIANAVGIAMAESHLAGVYNKPKAPSIIDHYTYCFVGDGCLMEGVASEACSLAGHWKLGKLIVFYDDNAISIEGSTDLAFTEDVGARFRSYGWQVLHVKEGNTDTLGIHSAITAARENTNQPTLIKVTTTIGYGAPSKQGTASAHGSCLGPDNISSLRKSSNWDSPPFHIPDNILRHTRAAVQMGSEHEASWNRDFQIYKAQYPELASQFEATMIRGDFPACLSEKLVAIGNSCTTGALSDTRATRATSHAVINELAATLPNFLGGSADLGPSNLTIISKEEDYTRKTRGGRNIHFGVREHAMGSITNGIALYTGTSGGLIPYCATFLVFSDYMRAAIRTAALSNAGALFIMTHDSVLLGEDGPTHQPIEHLWSLRCMPNVLTLRPADGVEVAAAYATAVLRRDMPSVLIFSRQKFGVLGTGSYAGALRGGYVHTAEHPKAGQPDVVLLATGSEISLVTQVAHRATQRGVSVRVVSMPCLELFEEQDETYRTSVLGNGLRECTIVVEAGATGGWWKYATHFVTVDDFGLSAPAEQVREAVGLTEKRVLGVVEGITGVCIG